VERGRDLRILPRVRKAWLSVVALAFAVVAGPARAADDDEDSRLSPQRLMPLVPLHLLPAGIGPEFAFGANATSPPVWVISWPFQIQTTPIRADVVNHRAVVAGELVVGSIHAGDPERSVEGEFRFRAGYRAMWHPGGGVVGMLAGIGSTLEFYPVVQPSISPEIGLHLGDPLAAVKFTLILRGDQYLAGGENQTRASLLAGWAFW